MLLSSAVHQSTIPQKSLPTARQAKPYKMRFVPKLISKPAGSVKIPKSITKRLRSWSIIPSSNYPFSASKTQGGSRYRQRYIEKGIFDDDYDYNDEDEDEDDGFGEVGWGEDGYVLVKHNSGGCNKVRLSGTCDSGRRSGTCGWEYGSRRMMV